MWTATERHLFADSQGHRLGKPGVSRYYDFNRIPGRARSHTRTGKWETFRLQGKLSGHRKAYTGTDGNFFQPRSMRPVPAPGTSWWSYDGPLVVVCSGLGAGELALPVRLPAAPSNQPILDHHLKEPEKWHKIDLVRRRDPFAAGGWRYEAHLMVLTTPYVSPETERHRATAASESAGRKAGIDVNVSNVTVASHKNGEDLRVTRIERDAGGRDRERYRAARKRRRERALERSRRAANPDQYHLSNRQEKLARRRRPHGNKAPTESRFKLTGRTDFPGATAEDERPWQRKRLPRPRQGGIMRASSLKPSCCGTAYGSRSRRATSRPGHGCGVARCTPSLRERSSTR